MDAGVKVTVNTDDPTVSGIDLAHEWQVVRREFGFGKAEERQLLMNSVELAFCGEELRRELMEKVEAGVR